MKSEESMKGLFCVVILALIICPTGCGVMRERNLVDEPLERAQVTEIRPGTTTKRDILEWFGPPLVAAKKGATMVFSTSRAPRRGKQELSSDVFFELFSSRHENMEHSIVYYYDSYAETGRGMTCFGYWGSMTIRSRVNRLWVLIDDKTGVVTDYVFRDAAGAPPLSPAR